MPIEQLITEAKTLLGINNVITDQAEMLAYTTSMRHRHIISAPFVALPQTTQQVAELVKLCRKHKVAIVPQGGNTGLVDGGLPHKGDEIIVSLARMNAVRAVDEVGLIATVEAGVMLQNLHDMLANKQLMFPLHIAAEGSAQIGGLIATNAGGTAVLRYGSMRSHVVGVEAVLPNGEIISTLKELAKDNTGYHLASAFIGAEGTLGIVTAAALHVLPIAQHKLTAIVPVANIEAAIELLSVLRREAAEHLSAFEFMSLNALKLLVKNMPQARFPANSMDAPYYLLVELNASSSKVPLQDIFAGAAQDAIIASSEAQAEQFWFAREHIPEALRVEKQRLHFDISVPVKSLFGFLTKMETTIKAVYPDMYLMPFGHIGDGNVHYNMYLPTPVGDFAAVKAKIQDMVFGEVDHWQGSISAEHGIGVERKAILAKLKPPAELNAMRAIKRAFDPDNMMNPGKIFD